MFAVVHGVGKKWQYVSVSVLESQRGNQIGVEL